jgi:hypothetical protein
MNGLLLAGSIAGVLGLAWFARLLALGGASIREEAEACRLAETSMAGFVATAAVVSSDGRAAVVQGAHGTHLRVKVQGANVAARQLRSPAKANRLGKEVVVSSGELMFGDVRLMLSPDDRDRLRGMM